MVEGYMDVIALAQYGLPIGIAPCGTAVTSEQIKLVSRHTDNLVLALDNDQAGFEATIRALKVAYAADMFPQIFQLPTAYKDIDQRLATSGQQIDAQMIKNMSSDGFSWIVQELLKRHDINNPVLRKKFLQT
ncbi:MAG: toprim domain-containing protein [Candidatus Peribacteria bacterium]|nr:MAG: toprim domain-containing protein [Candidatus Peribacteria bacterium]